MTCCDDDLIGIEAEVVTSSSSFLSPSDFDTLVSSPCSNNWRDVRLVWRICFVGLSDDSSKVKGF